MYVVLEYDGSWIGPVTLYLQVCSAALARGGDTREGHAVNNRATIAMGKQQLTNTFKRVIVKELHNSY